MSDHVEQYEAGQRIAPLFHRPFLSSTLENITNNDYSMKHALSMLMRSHKSSIVVVDGFIQSSFPDFIFRFCSEKLLSRVR